MRIPLYFLLQHLEVEDKDPREIKEALLQLGFECELDGDILDIEVLANRGDCLCIEGLARELCAYYNKKFTYSQYSQEQVDEDEGTEPQIQIIAEQGCSLYSARIIDNVVIEPSPAWLQKNLTCADIRPINNIVDIANFMMLVQGNPTHVFDCHKIKGRVQVRYSKQGEHIVTLDNRYIELGDGILVIADDVGVMALAGIVGSLDYAVTEGTKAVLVEAAAFDAATVRFGMKSLGIVTEAGYRFERHVNAANLTRVQNSIAALIKQLIPSAKIYKLITEGNLKLERPTIICEPSYFEKMLGHRIDVRDICEYLRRLTFEVKTIDGKLHVTVPYYRIHDVKRPADLVEEVARLLGYQSITQQLLHTPPLTQKNFAQFKNLRCIRQYLRNKGLHEVITYTFIPQYLQQLFGDNYLQLKNPLPLSLNTLRTTLLPGLLKTIATNIRHGSTDLGLFEIGRVFIPQDSNVVERLYLGIACVGRWFPLCSAKSVNFDFYALSGILSGLFNELGIEYSIVREEVAWLHPGKSAGIFSAGKCIATFGQIHPQIAKAFKLTESVVLGQVALDDLLFREKKYYKFTSLPKYTPVKRDISLIVRDEVECAQIIKIIKRVGGNLVDSVELFDYYTGAQIPPHHKSLSYTITFTKPDGVFTTEEINSILFSIIYALESEVDARVRN